MKESTPTTDTKEHAHELIERPAPNQVAAVVGVLEAMLDPVSHAIANAPVDDDRSRRKRRGPSRKPRSG